MGYHYICFRLLKYTTFNFEFKNAVNFFNNDSNRERLVASQSKKKDAEKDEKKVVAGQKVFAYNVMHHSVVCRHFEDRNQDLVFKLKFALSMSFYNIPVKNSLNMSRLFKNKWHGYAQDEHGVRFEMPVHVTNCDSHVTRSELLNEKSCSWKKYLSCREFDHNRGCPNTNILNPHLLRGLLDETICRSTPEFVSRAAPVGNIENEFTLNTLVSLAVELKFREGTVMPVQYGIADGGEILANFIDKNCHYETDKNEVDDNDKPHIMLVKFADFFVYCLRHQQLNDAQKFVWLMKNVILTEVDTEEEDVIKLKIVIRENEFTDKFWSQDEKLKLDKVCLSTSQFVNKTRFNEDTLAVIDKRYYSVFHGLITNYEEILKRPKRNDNDGKDIEVSVEITNEDENDDATRFLHWYSTVRTQYVAREESCGLDMEIFSCEEAESRRTREI